MVLTQGAVQAFGPREKVLGKVGARNRWRLPANGARTSDRPQFRHAGSLLRDDQGNGGDAKRSIRDEEAKSAIG